MGNMKGFYSYPAARPTMPLKAGLAYRNNHGHLADNIGDIYPQLNKSLLFAGIMLRFVGDQLTGPENTEYTVQGRLIGHIALIDEEIAKVLQELRLMTIKKKSSPFAM